MKISGINRRGRNAAGMALICCCAAWPCGRLLLAGQNPAAHARAKSPKSKDAVEKKKAPPEAPMPFQIGEKLDYRVSWSAFSDAANVELAVAEKRELFGWHTWHFQAGVHTVSPVRNLFTIDDQFDSYTDTSSLESRDYENYLNELGKKETDVMHLVPSGEKPRAPGSSVVVVPGTRDPLGMLFVLRGVAWQQTPELRAPVYDGRNLYDMHASVESAADPVQVDAGSFKAVRVALRLFQNEKEDPTIRFTVWLANDAAKTPVLISAQLPFGTLRVELLRTNQEHAELR